MKINKKQQLIKLFENWSCEKTIGISPLPPSGSYREYYRIKSKNKVALGVFNPDKKENIAFLKFSWHFLNKSLNVPEIYAEDLGKNIYLIQDLGDTTLYSYLTNVYKSGIFPKELIDTYKKVIEILPQFQIYAAKDFNYSICYPRESFDKQSMIWDLNYFKYYFLKLAKIPFDEQDLENDFQKFTNYLLKTDCSFFLYRDFQSRNIMIYNNEIYFIDYQGGRKGALQYDLASLLYDAKADIPQHIRNELLEEYIKNIRKLINIDEGKFTQYFYGYVLIRIMQAMGSYGFRGFYEKKEHFLQSIPYAIENLEYLLNNVNLPIKIPTLINVLKRVVDSEELKNLGRTKSILKVSINSFAYKKGIPVDISGNGGGFVFDCRAIHNPGRYEKYKNLTGLDNATIEFLEKEKDLDNFLNNVYLLVDQSVENYQQRKFTNLMVNFGCTGGRHRSVYCAEMLAKHLKAKYDIKVDIRHVELDTE